MLHIALINNCSRFFLPPMALFACALIAGIWIQSIIGLSLLFIYALISITGCAILFLSIHYQHSRMCIIPFIIMISLLGAWRLTHITNGYHTIIAQISNVPCAIQARIVNIEPVDIHRFKQCITLQAHAIQPLSGQTIINPSPYTITLYTLNPTNLLVGDMISIPSLTIKPQKKSAFVWYLMKQQILATIFCADPFEYTIQRPTWSLRRFLHNTKSRLFFHAKNMLSCETFSLYATLFLGKKVTDDPTNIIQEFRQWGVAHLLARSGIHLSLIIILWTLLLRLLPLPFLIKQLFLLVIALIYNMLSWGSISFGRAFYVFLLYRGALFLNYKINLLHTLATVCIFFILKNPIYIFYLDFQLSFLLTASLMWLNETIHVPIG